MPGTTLAGAHGSGEHGRMRYEYSVTSLWWIPSEAVGGSIRLAFDAGFIRYDEPAPMSLTTWKGCEPQPGVCR